jgi:hypothetical protein
VKLAAGPQIGAGAFATVHEFGPGAVLKVARPVAAAGGLDGFALATPLAFDTGKVGTWPVSPGDVVRAEGAVLSRVSHPAFVRLLGADAESLRLERIHGPTWRERMMAGDWPAIGEFVRLVEVLEDAVESDELPYHGDIKPENLLTDGSGSLRIIDPASGLNRYSNNLLPERVIVTIRYNPHAVPSDLPALGLMLIEISRGRHPLEALAAQPQLGGAFYESLAWRRNAGLNTLMGRLGARPPAWRLPEGEELEAVGLRCLGLAWDKGVLEMTEPIASLGDLRRELPRP